MTCAGQHVIFGAGASCHRKIAIGETHCFIRCMEWKYPWRKETRYHLSCAVKYRWIRKKKHHGGRRKLNYVFLDDRTARLLQQLARENGQSESALVCELIQSRYSQLKRREELFERN